MRVFISSDIEGIDGVTTQVHGSPQGEAYGHARLWMTEEANAAVRGARRGGATEVVVKDSHGPATNILLHELEGASLISGWGPIGSMVEGIDETFDALMLVGYHARIGTEWGVLSHTWCSTVRGLRINGEDAGECALSAMVAGHYGVPLAMVAGDEAATREAQALAPGVTVAPVKRGLARMGALMLPVGEARRRIEDAAADAMGNLANLEPFRPALPIRVELDVPLQVGAEFCSFVPGVDRLGPVTVGYTAQDALEAMRIFRVMICLAGSVREW